MFCSIKSGGLRHLLLNIFYVAGPSNNTFNLQGGLGPIVQSPGSPSRLLGSGPSNSPFPIIPMQHQGPVGTSSSLVLGINPINNIGRIGKYFSISFRLSCLLKSANPTGDHLKPDIKFLHFT